MEMVKNKCFNFILKLRFVPKALIACKWLNVFYIVLLVPYLVYCFGVKYHEGKKKIHRFHCFILDNILWHYRHDINHSCDT